MSPIIHDLRCPNCDDIVLSHYMEPDQFPPCQGCGATMTWIPTKVSTDIWGAPRQDTINDTGESTSRRELEKKMKAKGFEPAGDKVGGARNESHLNLGKHYSYAKQTKR